MVYGDPRLFQCCEDHRMTDNCGKTYDCYQSGLTYRTINGDIMHTGYYYTMGNCGCCCGDYI